MRGLLRLSSLQSGYWAGLQVDKSLQTSDWTNPSPEQINYAAIDAAISLEEFEKLKAMPDLFRCFTVNEIRPSKKVDFPQ